MLIHIFLQIFTLALSLIFAWFPIITTLPQIGGYDIDAYLVSGIGQFNTFVNAFWPIGVMFQGFLFLMGYYSLKILLRFLLGNRSPTA